MVKGIRSGSRIIIANAIHLMLCRAKRGLSVRFLVGMNCKGGSQRKEILFVVPESDKMVRISILNCLQYQAKSVFVRNSKYSIQFTYKDPWIQSFHFKNCYSTCINPCKFVWLRGKPCCLVMIEKFPFVTYQTWLQIISDKPICIDKERMNTTSWIWKWKLGQNLPRPDWLAAGISVPKANTNLNPMNINTIVSDS